MTESKPNLPVHSIAYSQYFEELNEEVSRIYTIAEFARTKGFDPVTRVEIPPAHDVAGRVEATLDGPAGVAKRIRELQEDHSREEVAFLVAKEIVTRSNVLSLNGRLLASARVNPISFDSPFLCNILIIGREKSAATT